MSGKTFYIGKHRVEEADRGYWVYPNNGSRGRYYAFGGSIAESIRLGSQAVSFENRARNFKPGTHEPVYYLRDENGRVGVPPEPGLPVPSGATLHAATSLAELDALRLEMNSDLYESFRDDGSATRYFDAAMGHPIETLKEQLRHPVSRMERDVIPLLIDELEDMERRNQREVMTDVRFWSRER